MNDCINTADPLIDYRNFGYVIAVFASDNQGLRTLALSLQYSFPNDGGVRLGLVIIRETEFYGVYMHEFGHCLGLTDLYNRQHFADYWSLMGYGCYLDPPSSITAPEKMWLGWILSTNITVVRAGQIMNVTLSPLESNGKTLVVKIPVDSPRYGPDPTYYLLEYRRKIRTDGELSMEGVLVSLINENVGIGFLKIMDAKPDDQMMLRDAAFTSGMRFVDRENEVAMTVLSMINESAMVRVQSGFADLYVDRVECVGERVEGKELYFDIYVENRGTVPSNFAIISLSINGTELERRGISSVSSGSIDVVRFGPWQAKAGVNQIYVLADASDNVVEGNKYDNATSATLYVSPRPVVIDKATITRQRSDVNSTQYIFFHAKWSDTGSDVAGGTIYVNGISYTADSTGWIKLAATSRMVGKRYWRITGVNAEGVTSYRQESPDPYIIWDALEVYESGASKGRADVGSIQTIWARISYAFDGNVFDDSSGSIWIGGKLAKWDGEKKYWYITDSRTTVGRKDYGIASVGDNPYGLTTLIGQLTKSVIWDRVKVVELRQR